MVRLQEYQLLKYPKIITGHKLSYIKLNLEWVWLFTMFDLSSFSVALLVFSFGHFDPLKSNPKVPENEVIENEIIGLRFLFWGKL